MATSGKQIIQSLGLVKPLKTRKMVPLKMVPLKMVPLKTRKSFAVSCNTEEEKNQHWRTLVSNREKQRLQEIKEMNETKWKAWEDFEAGLLRSKEAEEAEEKRKINWQVALIKFTTKWKTPMDFLAAAMPILSTLATFFLWLGGLKK